MADGCSGEKAPEQPMKRKTKKSKEAPLPDLVWPATLTGDIAALVFANHAVDVGPESQGEFIETANQIIAIVNARLRKIGAGIILR